MTKDGDSLAVGQKRGRMVHGLHCQLHCLLANAWDHNRYCKAARDRGKPRRKHVFLQAIFPIQRFQTLAHVAARGRFCTFLHVFAGFRMHFCTFLHAFLHAFIHSSDNLHAHPSRPRALTAAAAVTERIRLLTDILIAPLRTNTAPTDTGVLRLCARRRVLRAGCDGFGFEAGGGGGGATTGT